MVPMKKERAVSSQIMILLPSYFLELSEDKSMISVMPSRTFLAIGAATSLPVPPFSARIAIAILGFSAGAKQMNQAWKLGSRLPEVPVLPAILIPLTLALTPMPRSTSFTIMVVKNWAAWREMAFL